MPPTPVLHAELQIAGESVFCDSTRLEFEQPIDHMGRPNAGVKLALLEVTLSGPAAFLPIWQQLQLNSFRRESGVLVWQTAQGQTVRQLIFFNAPCVALAFQLDVKGEGKEAASGLRLRFSPAAVKLDGVFVELYSRLSWEKDPAVRRRALIQPMKISSLGSLPQLIIGQHQSELLVQSSTSPSKAVQLASDKSIIINNPGSGDVRRAEFVREIVKGERIADIEAEAKYRTFSEGLEHAVIKTAEGRRVMVSGGSKGIELPHDTRLLFGHTHPPVRKGAINDPSEADKDALKALNQSKQYIYHDGQRTTLYQNGDALTKSNY